MKTPAHIQSQGNALSSARWALKMARFLLLPLLLFLVFSATAHAQTTSGTTSDGLVWSASNGQVTITRCPYLMTGTANIPASVNVLGNILPVTSISAYVFAYSNITSVSIPSSVTSIGDGAFASCSGLISVIIPGSVTTIGGWAFNGCSGLTSVIISNGVISIGSCAFQSCPNLTSATIPDSVTSIGTYAFSSSGLTSVTIPGSVTSIDDDAFFNCTRLTSATISNGVKRIGNYAFQVSSLTSVTIPGSVTSIGNSAFAVPSLTNVTISKGVTSIGDYAFCDSGLTSVTIPSSVNSIGDYTFNCPNLKNAVFMGNAPTSMGSSVFDNTASGFTVDYFDGATGFTPTWNGYTAVDMGTPSPVITSTPLASGTAGTVYSQALTASGGIPPYTWSIVSGNLPAGLSLDSGGGVISGTASDVATANFTLQVADSNGMSSTADTSLTMNPASTGVPALPPWALVALPALLMLVAGRSLPREC